MFFNFGMSVTMFNKPISWIVGSMFLLLSGTTIAVSADEAELQQNTAVFGIIHLDEKGEKVFKPTNIVPLVVGQSYGWIISINPEREKVRWKEVFELPSSPDTWGSGEASGEYVISEDRTVSVTEKEVSVRDGHIQNLWSVAQGDPSGDYVIKVYVDDILRSTFNFKVLY